MLENHPKAYGGELLKRRKGRLHGRPLDTKNSMHMVLRSSKAKGKWSFKNPRHEKRIAALSSKFAQKNGIKIHSLANVGNHLHFNLKLSNRFTYNKFIRALTSAIAMAVTGKNRWNEEKSESKLKFWDYRPFTRVVQSFRGFLNLRDYIEINRIEGYGHSKGEARFIWSQTLSRGRP
jgi:REP element-mobilizing transposase RayT